MAEFVLIAGIGLSIALWLQPEPHSDWGYYWAAAGQVSAYERGGAGLWLLAIPKALGWSPVSSALLLNLASVVVLLVLMRRIDISNGKYLSLLLAFYLLLIAPFFGIVQLDLIATTLVASGMVAVMAAPKGLAQSLSIAMAVILIAAGVSTKPQYALICWTMAGLFILPAFFLRRRKVSNEIVSRILILTLFAGATLGFAFDSSLRELGGRSEAIRTNSAVTLYGGLLTSSDGVGCGAWSLEASKAARQDLSKPPHEAILGRLKEKPFGHWASVVRCKLPSIFHPPPFALYWLVESPNVRARINVSPQKASIEEAYSRALRFERKIYSLVTLAIMLSVVGTTFLLWRKGSPRLGLLGLLWVLSFWFVHAVFEIQGRYFLGMYMLSIVICALAIHHDLHKDKEAQNRSALNGDPPESN
ncbi:MAG: hypothetical protein Q4F49_05745 [Pseudoxanthomonas suwonensis]|nr:hypothetical protein [Pseudoxanthomonas suwonensis]